MGNEQSTSRSRHLTKVNLTVGDYRGEKGSNIVWTKNGRIPMSREATNLTSKAHFQLSRDASMNMLTKKTVKLTSKRVFLVINKRKEPFHLDPTPGFITNRTIPKGQDQVENSFGKRTLNIYQTPRMPTEREVTKIAIAYQSQCAFCEGPLIGDYLRCRVCIKSFHCQCLSERGHNQYQTIRFTRLGKQDWSCPECKDLTRLLTEDEMDALIAMFERIDCDKNGLINWKDFQEFQRRDNIPDVLKLIFDDEKELEEEFRLMDTKQKGAIEWIDFGLLFTCKLIARKNRTELTTKLTQKELAFAKNLFLSDSIMQIDSEGTIIISKTYLARVIYELTTVLKKKYGDEFLDAILREFNKKNDALEKFSIFGWDEFLRQISIFILLNRTNNDVKVNPLSQSTPTMLVSHTNLTSTDLETKRKAAMSRAESRNLTNSFEFEYSDALRKHGKILEKLTLRKEQRNKFQNSCTIVENLDDEDDFSLPKLKVDSRDERQSVTNPWFVVKEMQQLRNQPILITSTRLQVIKV